MEKQQIVELVKEGLFPEGDKGKKLIETSTSWIIIGNKYVYKIKKPVRFSFLDFSSLSKRKFYCEEELRLNRRLTNGIYLDLLTVYQNKKYHIKKDKGHAIDYVIQMKKMNLSKQMNFLIMKNKVTKDQIKSLAFIISEFHHNATRVYSSFKINEEIILFNDILGNLDFLKKHIVASGIKKIHFAIKKAKEFLVNNKKLFEMRSREGFVRDCHGDMHSGNIFLYKNPIIFDCIEFNKRFREIDIISEIAFICMDLESFNKESLSSYFITTYKEEDLSSEGLNTLFNYYKMQRANVRAKVNALKAMQNIESVSFKNDLKETIKYIDLMYSYALNL
jgi:aminoglycoside phosphotransferase family enzyme